ncbi:644_t:CDS:2, partial [Gigaspora rosea]
MGGYDTNPLTPESFCNGNGSFKKRTITHLQKPFDKLIQLGHYPSMSKFTPEKNGIAYQIPDKYEIETNLSGLSVRRKTKYQQGNISYMISWTNSYDNMISSSSIILA